MFDELEARMNQAIITKLSNALATIPDQGDVPVIFDAEYKVGMVGVVGMGASSPQIVIANSETPADFIGMQIAVRGRQWTVVERQADDELPDGISKFILERA